MYCTYEKRKATVAEPVSSHMAAVEADTPARVRGPRRSVNVATVVSRGGVPIVLALLFLVFSITLPDTFPTFSNVSAMLTSTSVLIVLALALTIPLRAGDFDLSIAATMGFSAAIVAVLTVNHHVSLITAILAALAAGLVIGAANGVLIVGAGVNAFIATLGMLTVLSGLTYAITNGQVVLNLPGSLQSFWRHNFLGLQFAVWFGWLLALVLLYFFEGTPLGRYLLFVGGNQDAARLSGLPVRTLRFGSFLAAGFLSAVAGIILAGTLGAVDPSVASAYLLPPYTAAFLGTTTILVGRFNILGSVIGLYLVTVGITGLELLGVASWIGDVFNGGILIVAVLFARLGSKLASRGRAPRN
jgi:ribose transport system permease protein